MREKRQNLRERADSLRKLLLLEPRGYPCQNANFVFPSAHSQADYGFVIAEQGSATPAGPGLHCMTLRLHGAASRVVHRRSAGKIYPMMSGHNAICVATVLLETGMIPIADAPTTRFSLETPAGIIQVDAECSSGKVTSVTIQNQPAFCRPEDLDLMIEVPTVGKVCPPYVPPPMSVWCLTSIWTACGRAS